MTKKKMLELNLGLYKLYWNSGGFSLAAVGMLHDGTKWFAPTNWTAELYFVTSTDWRKVKKAELIMVYS